MFDGIPSLVSECETCEEGQVKRWKRINLWRSHDYYYDAEAVRMPQLGADKRYRPGSTYVRAASRKGWPKERGDGDLQIQANGMPNSESGANFRNVWSIPTQSYKGAHFATFPEELPRRCILAGTSAHGVCGACGAQWVRVV